MNLIKKFRSAIRRGTGKTHLLMRENPKIDFSPEIIKACLFNYAYDRQSEGSREVYLSELIEMSDQKDKILKIIYQTLIAGKDDSSLEPLVDIATIFAKRGDKNARKAVYKDFQRCGHDCNWCGRSDIVEIDGLKGLNYVADSIGKSLLKRPEEWDDSFFVDYFQEQNPTIDVYQELRLASEENSNIKKYLETIEKHKFTVKTWKSPTFDYNFLKERVDNNKIVYLPEKIVEKFPQSDLKKLADDFLREKKPSKQEKYLRIFARVKYPYNYEYLLELAKSKNSKKKCSFILRLNR